VEGKHKEVKQYGLTRIGYILEVKEKEGYILHRISTEEGQSGAAAILEDAAGRLSIAGLHVGYTTD